MARVRAMISEVWISETGSYARDAVREVVLFEGG